MNVSDILTLAKAGFTAEQIGKLMQIGAPAPVPAPAPAPVPAPAPAPVPAPEPAPVKDNTQEQFDKVFQQIANLTGIVQKGNLQNAQVDNSKTLTAEDVLSEIIRPN
mgnify:CR=1 FL=1|jgi:hypothetical protein